MKHLVAAWLLVGLSLGMPQFGKGEVAGQGSLDEGRAGSTFGNAALKGPQWVLSACTACGALPRRRCSLDTLPKC